MVAKIRIFNLFGIPFFCGGCLRNEKHRGGAVGRGRVAPERHCTMLLVLITVSFLREESSFLNFDGDVLDCIYQRLFERVPLLPRSSFLVFQRAIRSLRYCWFSLLGHCVEGRLFESYWLLFRGLAIAQCIHCSNIECLGRSDEWALLGWHDWLYRSR